MRYGQHLVDRACDHASMRPRRARLGCMVAPRKASPAFTRFNEAEARAPRMPSLGDRGRCSGRLGFNEAEARAPRMPAADVADHADAMSFNEAEARAPRMRTCSVTSALSSAIAASMRPRRARLGCELGIASGRQSTSRFNEAEARAPRMLESVMRWRRRMLVASMRPRRARLGCRVAHAARTSRQYRFNEAEARAPRMQRCAHSRCRTAAALQ